MNPIQILWRELKIRVMPQRPQTLKTFWTCGQNTKKKHTKSWSWSFKCCNTIKDFSVDYPKGLKKVPKKSNMSLVFNYSFYIFKIFIVFLHCLVIFCEILEVCFWQETNLSGKRFVSYQKPAFWLNKTHFKKNLPGEIIFLGLPVDVVVNFFITPQNQKSKKKKLPKRFCYRESVLLSSSNTDSG